jgi:hypothetical protein
MRFTAYQYDRAIEALQDAKKQLESEANPCSVCGDSGHLAYECGFNPLVAVAMCKSMATGAEVLHETLHAIAGYDQAFGVQLGPARIIVPPESKETDPNAV